MSGIFTRQHYEALATLINDHFGYQLGTNEPDVSVASLLDMLKADNPNFNKSKFMASTPACREARMRR
jgi:hypothetical protein